MIDSLCIISPDLNFKIQLVPRSKHTLGYTSHSLNAVLITIQELCGQDVQLLNVTPDDTQIKHWVLKAPHFVVCTGESQDNWQYRAETGQHKWLIHSFGLYLS